MTLLDIKKNIEQFFMSNYNETDVHWAGTKFDTKTRDEWVYFEYLGKGIMDCGFDNTKNKHTGVINVTVVALSTFRVSEIASIIAELFKGKEVEGSIIRGVSIIEQGYDSDIDKSYMILNLNVTSN